MNIHVIDDDRLLLQTIRKSLEMFGHSVTVSDSGQEALEKFRTFSPDLILLDINLGDINGIEFLKTIKEDYNDIPVIMITAYTDVSTVVAAMKAGAEDYIGKPLDLDYLEITLNKAEESMRNRERISLLEEKLSLENRFTLTSFQSAGMQEVLQFVGKVSKGYDTSVLIEGESGTGKEVVARMVHENSPRAGRTYVAINCGAIPKDLIENELFGSEKGAFTGALNKTKKGKFELAGGGTILLDEIGELSAEAQVKLLRVLQERKFYRVGGNAELAVDVRVIATTNKNLEEESLRGNFREDLYYRLNVARVVIPPLRERKEDIIPLAELFIEEFCLKFRKQKMRLSGSAKKFLQNYYWRGNIRELKNAIERVVLFEDAKDILQSNFDFLSVKPVSVGSGGGAGYLRAIPPEGVTIDAVTRELCSMSTIISR